ncbi:MAG: carboxylating nicotinate-nucleotide diphosphorylase, partial [Deltaproteobacteria bacterium]|nr:carboxylating nicotinate-nucleotide diphosphorylase [Deltaproteobacteria bacterium]
MELQFLIRKALEEDLGSGDITTNALVDPRDQATAEICAKQELVLAGLDVAKEVFATLDSHLVWKLVKKDGDIIKKGECVATVQGATVTLLKGERTALNFLQHLSGVATLTRQFVNKIEGTNAKILDTRKTLPGWRTLEKYAVRMGGGGNHRAGLFDRYLIKNNHIAHAGSVSEAIEKVLRQKIQGMLVEVEVQNKKELQEALKYPIDIILLDNFLPDQIREAIL